MSIDCFKAGLLSGRTAVVVGASGGINLEVARTLGTLGARLALVSRSAERIEAAAASLIDRGVDAVGLAADVRDYERVSEVVSIAAERLGPIDIVVSGAAGNFVAPASALSAKGFKTVVDIDLNGSFHVARAAYVHMKRPGCLINISAPQASVAYPYQAHVSAAKAGVEMLTRSLAMEWGAEGIRVNAVVPGPVADTEGMRRLTPDERSTQAIAKAVPLRRYAAADEIASLVAFLVSDAARYITGAIVPCDGGILLAGPEAFGSSHPVNG
jgi:NAD(P)-dependent dehydrogenase (short-subunit alcohol dehydrogenase family)